MRRSLCETRLLAFLPSTDAVLTGGVRRTDVDGWLELPKLVGRENSVFSANGLYCGSEARKGRAVVQKTKYIVQQHCDDSSVVAEALRILWLMHRTNECVHRKRKLLVYKRIVKYTTR